MFSGCIGRFPRWLQEYITRLPKKCLSELNALRFCSYGTASLELYNIININLFAYYLFFLTNVF